MIELPLPDTNTQLENHLKHAHGLYIINTFTNDELYTLHEHIHSFGLLKLAHSHNWSKYNITQGFRALLK